jgi:hypothetical protein
MKRSPLPTNLAPIWQRCLKYVDPAPNGCWEWTGAKSVGGYGRVSIPGNQQRLVHVISYAHHCGVLPAGLVVAHLCHNPCCCNPVHLQPMTQLENVRQSIDRGTFKSHRRPLKLTPQQRLQIKADYKHTASDRLRLAAEYGVSESLIAKILYRERQEASN